MREFLSNTILDSRMTWLECEAGQTCMSTATSLACGGDSSPTLQSVELSKIGQVPQFPLLWKTVAF